MKAIGESKSKQEEDRIIAREVQCLKQKLEPPAPGVSHPLQSKKRAKEFLVRLLYVEMLGHDASFGYIKAVEMAASASLYHKRTGYLVCAACLSPEHEFRFMLVNQMQRDLQSGNTLEISGGLQAATALITNDMVPAVAGEVTKLLSHESEVVRKKAIIAMHRFHELAPDVVSDDELFEKIRKVLCDRDPSVMGSCLNVIESMAVKNPTPFKDLIPSLVSILKQIGEHRLPTDYDYHRVPAPWMQIRIVRILSLLGEADANASSGMYEILLDTLKKADIGINAGYAIVYECIKCITKIYPNTRLLDAAAGAISRFIDSRSHNLKYLGVTGLAMIVESHPQYAAQHQMSVMDCLEDSDETLQRKTLDLLYRMTNPVNVEFITDKLLDFLGGTTDLFLKQQLTTRVCSVAERYAPNNAWYIQTITNLFQVSGDMVDLQVAQNLMTLIAEGTGESDEQDMFLRQTAIELYIQLLQDKPPAQIPKILLETMAWCLGEYSYLSSAMTLEQILQKLCQWNKEQLADSTRKFLTSAIFKLVSQAGTCPPEAAALVDEYTRSKDVDLQQRCLEFQNMLTMAPQYLGEILPVDASAEDVDVDINLSFLDSFCQEALANGAKPYCKPEDDDDDDDIMYGSAATTTSAFKMTPYAKPETNVSRSHMIQGLGSGGITSVPGVALPPGAVSGNAAVMSTQVQAPGEGMQLNTRGVNVWGKKVQSQLPQQAPAMPAPAPPPVPASSFGQNSNSTNRYGGFGTSTMSSSTHSGFSAPVVPQKTPEQLEKERMAAALFGGIVPGAPPPPRPAPAPRPQGVAQTVAPPVAAPPIAAPPVSAPAPEVDLLDLGFFDSGPPAAAPQTIDIFASTPNLTDRITAPAGTSIAPSQPLSDHPHVVETVSDDEVELAQLPVTPPVTSIEPVDPFAAEGLLGGVTDVPLKIFGLSSSVYEFNGSAMAPMKIVTAQFGQQWGSCTATSPLSITSSKVVTLDQFMKKCEEVGLHGVESIRATSEGICAGMINAGTIIVLVHGKVTPMGGAQAKLDVTVKSTDSTLSGSLALYLQNIMQ